MIEASPTNTPSPDLSNFPFRWSMAALVVVAGLLVVLALVGPPNLLSNDQEKPAGYVADIIHNGSWLLQRDQTDDVASKPPLQNWLSALAVMAVGRDGHGLLTEAGLRLPSLLAVLATAALIFRMVRSSLGRRAACLAALAFLLSMPALRMVGLVRTDPLFTLLVAASAWGVLALTQARAPWWPVGLLLLLAAMTKGPLALLLATIGLLGVISANRPAPAPRLRVWGPRLAAALVLPLAGTLLWFLVAILTEGHDVWNKLIRQELVGLAVHAEESGPSKARTLFLPLVFLIPRWAPWSVVTLVGLVLLARDWTRAHPVLRFSAVWFLGGMAIFMAGAHHRMDHLYPLLPAAALIVGWTLDQGLRRGPWARGLSWVVLVVGGFIFLGSWASRFSPNDLNIRRSMACRQGALTLVQLARPGEEPQFVVRNAPQAVQFYLGINRPAIDHDLADRVLLETSETLVLSRERGERSVTLGVEKAGGVVTLWGTELNGEGGEDDTDRLWNMGIVAPAVLERPANWPWRGHRAVLAGETTIPVVLGPTTVVEASKRRLVLQSDGRTRDAVFPAGDPDVEVIHAEDYQGRRWPVLPLSRPVASVLFLVACAAILALIRMVIPRGFVSRETSPWDRGTPDAMPPRGPAPNIDVPMATNPLNPPGFPFQLPTDSDGLQGRS
jgi:4-amino-4-deoxy-L-arabinose transferase-like glycosyltransferase